MNSEEKGINCPKCGQLIPLTIPLLLSGEPIVCPFCQQMLHVDKESSKDGLRLMSEYDRKISKILLQYREL